MLASAVILAQAIVGGIVVISKLSIFATLAHAGLMGLLFVVLCDVARRTISWNFATGSRRPAPDPGSDARRRLSAGLPHGAGLKRPEGTRRLSCKSRPSR